MKRANESVPERHSINGLKLAAAILAWVSLLALASPGRCACLSAEAPPLAADGQARAVIVIPSAASESTKWAVGELQRDHIPRRKDGPKASAPDGGDWALLL